MNEQRSHYYDPALGREAIDRHNLGGELANSVIAKHAYRVGLWQHPQRASVFRRIVQMHPKRDHTREGAGWRASMDDPTLQRPRSPSWNITFFAERQHSILMPRDKPVCIS